LFDGFDAAPAKHFDGGVGLAGELRDFLALEAREGEFQDDALLGGEGGESAGKGGLFGGADGGFVGGGGIGRVGFGELQRNEGRRAANGVGDDIVGNAKEPRNKDAIAKLG